MPLSCLYKEMRIWKLVKNLFEFSSKIVVSKYCHWGGCRPRNSPKCIAEVCAGLEQVMGIIIRKKWKMIWCYLIWNKVISLLFKPLKKVVRKSTPAPDIWLIIYKEFSIKLQTTWLGVNSKLYNKINEFEYLKLSEWRMRAVQVWILNLATATYWEFSEDTIRYYDSWILCPHDYSTRQGFVIFQDGSIGG